MADTQSTVLQGKGMMPSLTVNDLDESLKFFTGLGFEIEERWEHEGVVLGAMLKAGNTRLGLSLDDGKKGSNRVKGVGMRLYLEVSDDIDAAAARARTAGVALSKEPYDTDWKTRAFEVIEPSGFALTITSPAR